MNNDRKKFWVTLAKKINYQFLFLVVTLILFGIFFVWNQELFDLIMKGDLKSIREMLDGEIYSYIFTLLLMILQNSFTIVPLILMITIDVTLFGFINGFLWSWITSIVAAILVFFCVRFIFQDWLVKKFKPEQIALVEQKGFVYVFQARVFPFIPTSLTNILAGLSTIRFSHFLLGTILGNFLYFFLLALIPAGIFSSSLNEFEMGIIILLIFGGFYGFNVWYKRHKRKPRKENEPRHFEG
ncbi:TVP38/TMEM64 family protein [Cytobacillus sp. Hz8]|uniref:TVP38/TMEM64 family protein n=1 Tax=Cytobacillus sp. Hz8 TaxID=3347168 RepID=UPI0035D9D9E5